MKRPDEIRTFALQNIDKHPKDIVSLITKTFSISRQMASRHVNNLVKEKIIMALGSTKSRVYSLPALIENKWVFPLSGLDEDIVWRNTVSPILKDLPANIIKICQYGLTEMVNNTIDHSEGQYLTLSVTRNAANIEITVSDDGIGIFNKIKRDLNLDDILHSILELSKGKLTTDPKRHSGEGIFFTSRMFDEFSILSSGLYFKPSYGEDENTQDWLFENKKQYANGTIIFMKISSASLRATQKIFDSFSVDGDFGFSKTYVPVFLAQYGGDNLISRSQAKRLLTRFERFKEIILDFNAVESVGQAFADEIFRVFRDSHPQCHLVPVNTNEDVSKMIAHVLSG